MRAASKIEPVVPEWNFAWDQLNRAADEAIVFKQAPKELMQDDNRQVQAENDKRVKSAT
jgi:hypothetical protein